MRLVAAATSMLVLVAATVGMAVAQPSTPKTDDATHDARRSGFDYMTHELQAMQRDDSSNPAMLFVQEGAAMWEQPAGASQRSCSSCHGAAATAMRGVAARYPAFDAALGKPIDLEGRIDRCRVEHQQAPAFGRETEAMLGLESFVVLQSRGTPIAASTDARLAPSIERGHRLFEQRMGQLDFSCSQCHDGHAGQSLGGSTIPEAHPTGYPIYRLEWQGMGSLQRRLRSCVSGVRAEPFGYGSQEMIELELYMKQRAAGMKIDAPAVRP